MNLGLRQIDVGVLRQSVERRPLGHALDPPELGAELVEFLHVPALGFRHHRHRHPTFHRRRWSNSADVSAGFRLHVAYSIRACSLSFSAIQTSYQRSRESVYMPSTWDDSRPFGLIRERPIAPSSNGRLQMRPSQGGDGAEPSTAEDGRRDRQIYGAGPRKWRPPRAIPAAGGTYVERARAPGHSRPRWVIAVSDREFLERLMAALEKGEDWSLRLGMGDQTGQLTQLMNDLKLPFSEIGEGKHFASGFSYMGLEPTLAWARASSDPLYMVMKNGIETFQRRWAAVRASLDETSYHYLSLGPGTGEKDVLVLRDLESEHRARRYLPVDMSDEMLWLAIRQVLLNSPLPRNRITPIQLD